MGKSCSGKSCMVLARLARIKDARRRKSKEAILRAQNQARDQRTYQSDEAAQYICGGCGLRAAGPSPTARERPEAEKSSSRSTAGGKEILLSRSRGRIDGLEVKSTKKIWSPSWPHAARRPVRLRAQRMATCLMRTD